MSHDLKNVISRRRSKLVRRLCRAEIAIPTLALLVLGALSTPHVTRANDERIDPLVQRTVATQDAVSRFRQRATTNFDPTIDGWDPLLKSGYLDTVPTNPITGSSTVTRFPTAASGWTYDPATGRLDACVIDSVSGEARLLRDHR